ncbi:MULTISPECIES: OPT family oligopeptide transporter [Pelosinus]|uniref:Oligopeptide transporter, OPT family n=1 Tax=Pelosinus fermentans B4 TaxID=1149862 RepID=I9LEJ7_9FIRM|nr:MULTISPECIES: oligopeptide transporter, OPT family [Pelosinus]EIW18786.1 oligopeptide transporter, OPT family [Pelosinus fermentans B4]EIW22004.1 oligopeptide transporter, OPT family [Pelosinus fermentans A11]OAM95144.1 oligopeptide transporter, OPT family [Pelosinus fermentans DSM 17108]SDR23912.1 putative oligopeptide transporter, OPT family [Pelosinus fermentans]
MKQVDFMSHELNVPELTLRGILLGMIITVIFTASNVYLGLKVGLTFSSSIPAAVISMAILKMFKDSNVLENNMVQTQASAAGTLSAVIFIIPGLLMLGYWQGFAFWQTLMICACGGGLGVLFTIPLRRAMIVNSDLPYPEGLAAAEILKVGSSNAAGSKDNGIKDIMFGGIFSAIVSLCAEGFHAISSGVHYWFSFGKVTSQLPLGFSSALLGAGYLIGIASGMAMLAGTILSWGVFVPYLTSVMSPAAGQSASAFASAIWAQKVRLIGAGAIGIAAIWTLITLIKPIIDGMRISIQAMSRSETGKSLHRMDTDLSPKTTSMVLSIIVIGLLGTFYSFIADANLSAGTTGIFVVTGVAISICMGFFVAAACGYMAGLIGTSASPISGIGILGIIVSSLVVLGIGTAVNLFDTEIGSKFAIALAIFMTSVIVSIAAISNDNLQDLKTGYLVGATPWKQQVALLVGCVVGAFAIAPVLNLLYEAYGFVGAMPRTGMDESQVLSAPQATLMTTIAQGIFSHNLDWNYILFGVGVGISIIIVDVLLKKNSAKYCLPPLAVGMGIYLPPTLEVPLIIGAVMGYFVNRYLRNRAIERSPKNIEEDVEKCNRHGVLFASGLIVGESIMGVIIAIIIVLSVTGGGSDSPLAIVGKDFGPTADWLGLLVFIAMIAIFIYRIVSVKFKTN